MTDIDLNAVREGWHQVITAFPSALTTVAYHYENGGWFIPDPDFNEASLVGARITPLYLAAEVARLTEERDEQETEMEVLRLEKSAMVATGLKHKRAAIAAREERDGLAAANDAASKVLTKHGIEGGRAAAISEAKRLLATPAATLAARDAEKKAEALEEAANWLESAETPERAPAWRLRRFAAAHRAPQQGEQG
jgi:hypothetical protein